jgi:hypothetical protein
VVFVSIPLLWHSHTLWIILAIVRSLVYLHCWLLSILIFCLLF